MVIPALFQVGAARRITPHRIGVDFREGAFEWDLFYYNFSLG